MKSRILIVFSIFLLNTGVFAQQQKDNVINYPNILFTQPADATWTEIPANQSFVPFMMNKISEVSDTTKKVSFAYQNWGRSSDVLSLFEQINSVLSRNWSNLSSIEPIHLISPPNSAVSGGPRKFSSVHRIIDRITETSFRLEVVIVSEFNMLGNKGILFILCPEYAYFENRFLIKQIRDSLSLTVEGDKAATNN